MKTFLRALALGLLALWAGCADFDKAEQGFCERNPGRCGELPVKIGFNTAPQRVQVGSCSAVVTVQFLGADDTLKTVKADTPLALSATPSEGFQFFTDEGCTGTPVTAVAVPASANSASFYFKGARVGPATLSASTGSLSGSQEVTLTPTPPAALALVLPASPVTAGTCTSGRVQVRDANGSTTLVTTATNVGLEEVPSTSLAFYSDAACTTPSRSVTVAENEGEAAFYFLGQATGRVTVIASAAELTPASQNVDIAPGTSHRLIFVTSPQVAVAGECSAVVSIQSRDAQGAEPVPTSSLTTIRLAASPSEGFRFYSDASCATEVSAATLAEGTTNASFYFKGAKSGNVTVTVTAAGFTGSSQAETINPGPPSAMALVGPAEVPAGDCSAPVTVELRDAQGNPTAARANTVLTLSASGIPLTFFPEGGCTSPGTSLTIPQGSLSAVFSFRGVQAGNATLSVASQGLSRGTLGVTIASSPTSVLTFTTGAQTLPAGTCSAPVTVQVGPPGSPLPVAAAVPVTLSAPPDVNVTFSSSPNCSSAVSQVSIPAGQSSASFYFRSTKAGSAPLTAAATGLTSASQAETITAAPPTRMLFSTPPHTPVAGTCSPLVSLQSVDDYGNVSPVTSNNQQVSFNAQFRSSFDGQFGFYSDPGCTTSVTSLPLRAGESSVGIYYRGVRAQAVIFQTFGSLTGASQEHTIIPASARTLSFSPATPPQTLLAGTCALRTVQSRDAYDNPSANALTLELSAEPQAEFFLDAACTTRTTQASISAGSSSASFYFKGLSGGINETAPLTLKASSPGLTAATQTETVIPTVRSDLCTLSGSSTTCPITPPLRDLAKAFLVFQATTSGLSNAETHVRCSLEGTSSILCDRASSGPGVNVRWSVAEFPSGVAVQHYQASCNGSYVSFNSPVVPNQSFLLLSSKRSGTTQDSAALRYAELTSPFEARIAKTGSCSSSELNHLQVVDYAGASVQRGLSSMGSESLEVTLPTPVAPERSILLYSYSSSLSSSLCSRMLRGELKPTGETLRFSRGEGGSFNCASSSLGPISWEVVQFPPGTVVQQVTRQITGTFEIVTLSQPVDPSRTFLIAGGQWASGQVQGESQSTANHIGEMRAQAYLESNSTLRIVREMASSTATFTVFVVQLKP